MTLFIRLSIFIILLTVTYSNIVNDFSYEKSGNYISLITDLKHFYNVFSVFAVYGDVHKSLSTATFMFNTVKQLSTNQIFAQAIGQSDLYTKYGNNLRNHARQLFVIYVASEEDLYNFGAFATSHRLSFHIWLVLFWGTPTKSLLSFCEHPKINLFALNVRTKMLVKCYDDPILREWYYLNKINKFQVLDLMKWTGGSGLTLYDQRNFILRRRNFLGEFIAVSVVARYNNALMDGDAKRTIYQAILMQILNILNITIESLSFEDSHGIWDGVEKKWNGVFGQLASGKIDIIASGMIQTKRRYEHFDMTWPLVRSRSAIYCEEPPDHVVQWSAYLKGFKTSIWITILIYIMLSSLLLNILHNKAMILWKNQLMENYLYVWGIYCQQGLSENPDSYALKIAYLSLFFSAMAILAFYSGSLISHLTIFNPTLPFDSLEGLVQDKSYKVSVLKNSADHEMFKITKNPIFSKMREMLMDEKDLPVQLEEAFSQVCSEKIALYASIMIKDDFFDKLPCKMSEFPMNKIRYVSLALKKNSALTIFVNYYIHRFREHGIINRYKNLYSVKQMEIPSNMNSSVSLWEIAPLLAILLIGIVLSLVVLYLENLRSRRINSVDSTNKFYWKTVVKPETETKFNTYI